ncbi:PHP domain-containing protein [candidate division KSB1 bacterium]|nr:PHP domain-containing protein [candidate division KSB1 bacterium]
MKAIKMYLIVVFAIYSSSACWSQTETAQLNFTILDKDSQQPIPAKLVFTQGENDNIDLGIPETFALAPEGNGFYTALGKGEVNIPVGEYTIYVSRGMEYSIDKKTINFEKNAVINQIWTIEREINPPGFVGADVHMHTTNSDGHCSPEERVSSLVGEGVEFAVATDHNFVTDFMPEVEKLNVGKYLTTCPGNELSASIGHFNIYPIPPNTKPFDHSPQDAHVLFSYRDNLPAPTVNQVNHPRRGDYYFAKMKIEPVTGKSSNPLFSDNFEALEIMNNTYGWGLFTGPPNKISVWDEWLNYLNSGFRFTGVGNTDTHHLLSMPVGTPRNYIASPTDDPAQLDPYLMAGNIIKHKVTVARYVFVNLSVNEKWPVGSDVIDTDGAVDIRIEMAAPSCAKVDEVTLYGNGREIWTEEIPAYEGTLDYSKKITIEPALDTWYVVKAEGSQSLWPIVPDQNGLAVTPVGFTNPVWIDIDGNGFETERDRAKQFVEKHTKDPDDFRSALQNTDWWLQRQITAILPKDSEFESIMIETFLLSKFKIARQYAYSRLNEKADISNIALLKNAKQHISDENERMLVDTYIAQLGPKTELIDFMFDHVINSASDLRMEQCNILATNTYPTQWQVVGPFNNEGTAGLNVSHAPEDRIDFGESYNGKGGAPIQWRHVKAVKNGYIDFTLYISDKDHSLAYAYARIQSSEKFKTVLCFGSDDGAAIWHSEKEIYRNLNRRSAKRCNDVIPVELEQGENEFLVKVENGTGGWGFYFEIFDPLDYVVH